MEFEKIGQRYVLPPKERVITLLKKYKELSISSIHEQVGIQYDVLQIILQKLSDEGKLVIIKTTVKNIDDKEITGNINVIWKGNK